MANYYNKDLYKILGVNIDASETEIKAAYKKLALKYHPDVAGKNADETKFKEVQEAYEILKNIENRKKYDILHGFYTEKIKKEYEIYNNTQNKNKYEEFIKQVKAQKKNSPESFTKSINDALENLFHSQNMHKKQAYKPPVNGEDINIDVSISCFEAINGTNRKVNILHTQPCPNCHGRTFINGTKCSMCNGSGEISQQKKINVKIPKGVYQGSKVRIKKEGNKGQNGGKDGDLFLIINVEKNSYFDIEGLNILCNLPITPYEAVLGAEIPLYIMNETINVKIPPMTSSGQKLKLAGQGLENKSKTKKGDIIITVLIKLPEQYRADELELYKRLQATADYDIRKDLRNASK
ncbi:J domain-containing protein [bacterium]|nr:J domain-containing protein [bacterium]